MNPDDPKPTDEDTPGDDFDGHAVDAYGQFVDESFDEIADSFRLMNTFTEEIENVSASDWDLDADALWGGVDEPTHFGPDPGSAFDIPI
jgi:hypothetical protein